MGAVASVNLGGSRPNPAKPGLTTGFAKRPVDGPVAVRAPGTGADSLGSGLVGDHVGDRRHHGGDVQAVYAFAREELDAWERELGHELPAGSFGENLTTRAVAVDDAVLGERWRIGSAELVVTCPRIPCNTFRAAMERRDWLKAFTRAARPGAYLAVAVAGELRAGDAVDVLHRPDHDVTVELAFRALTLEHELRPRLLEAGADLIDELREVATGRLKLELDT